MFVHGHSVNFDTLANLLDDGQNGVSGQGMNLLAEFFRAQSARDERYDNEMRQFQEMMEVVEETSIQAPETPSASSDYTEYVSNPILQQTLSPLLEDSTTFDRIRRLDPAPDSTVITNNLSKLHIFCRTFVQGQLAPILMDYGFGAEVISAANSGSLQSLVAALETRVKREDDAGKEEEKHFELD